MEFLLRPLLSLYQENRATINRAISATWLSGMVWLILGELPVYPAQWRAVIAAGVLVTGLWTVEWAFYIAVLSLLYPLYHISIYVMVLFLAATALLGTTIIAHFNQTLLVVSVPFLAQVHLEAMPALLAGLLWGAGSGMWVGGLAALWFKLLGGMSGLDIDLGILISSFRQPFDGAQDFVPLSVGTIMDRFHTANSLETLQRLVEPFAPSSTVALSHLLQIFAWGIAGYLVGGMARRGWIDERRFAVLGRVVCLVAGAALLSAGNLWVPVWLGLRPKDEMMAQVTPAVIDSLFAIAVMSLFDGCRRLFNRPLPARRMRKKRGNAEGSKARKSEGPKPLPLSHKKIPEPVSSDQDDDIIMIELD